LAPRYAARPLDHPDAYAAWLARARSYLTPDSRVLEVGCGTGSTAIALAPDAGEILATDFSPAMIEIARSRAGDTPNLRFDVAPADRPQGQFDVVMAFSLLHLLPDRAAGLAALAAQVKPGGLLITKTVCLWRKRLYLGPVIAVLRLLGKAPQVHMVDADRLVEKIRAAGFEIVEQGDYPAGGISRFIVARKL